MKNESWKQVWERKGSAGAKPDADAATYGLPDLIAFDGFDGALGKADNRTWQHIITTVKDRLDIRPGDHLIEVGCGAGAILFGLTDIGATLVGTDYSAPHVEIARKALPRAHFQVAEACAQPFADDSFDRVLSHGVFLYFADHDYARRTIAELVRICRSPRRILIMDIPDAAKQSRTEAARRAAGASLSPSHLYYPKEFFEEAAVRHGLRAIIFDQNVPGYGNAAYRFNVILESAIEQ